MTGEQSFLINPSAPIQVELILIIQVHSMSEMKIRVNFRQSVSGTWVLDRATLKVILVVTLTVVSPALLFYTIYKGTKVPIADVTSVAAIQEAGFNRGQHR